MLLLRRLLCALVIAGILGSAGSTASAASWHLDDNGGNSIGRGQTCAPTSDDQPMACDDDCNQLAGSEVTDCGPCKDIHACAAVLARVPLVDTVETSRTGTAGVQQQAAGLFLPPPFGPPRPFS